MKQRLLYILFTVSGFCGLIYQSIWSHYLKLFLGHAAYAQTVVLVVFIGGMAIGAWWAGSVSRRVRNPLWAYAAAEFVVGIAALLFHQLYVGVTDWAYASLLPAACEPDGWCLAQWAVAALLILPQSLLLGTTFPFMTAGVLRISPDLPGRRISLLYFLNSIGAAIGVITSGFLLIPSLGLPGALLTAGIGNIVLAAATYFIGKSESSAQRVVARPDGVADNASGPRSYDREAVVLLLIAALTGLSSFIYEIAWIRALALVLGSSTHAFELMLAAFIGGLAFGSLWISRRIDRIGDTVRFLAIVQVVMGILAILTLPLFNWLFDAQAWLLSGIARTGTGYAMFNLTGLGLAMLVMVPTTFCAGMTLPLITYRLLATRAGERAIGHVYAVNTLGAIIGVLFAVHVGLPHLGIKGAMIIGGAIDIALGVALLALLVPGAMRRTVGVGWTAAGAACIAAGVAAFSLDPLKVASGVYRTGAASLPTDQQVLFARDGKAATVHVTRTPEGVVAIRTNGKSDGAALVGGDSQKLQTLALSDEHTMVLTAAIPLMYRPNASNVAVIGFGTGITTATVLGSPRVARVDTIEIEPAIVDGARHFLPLTAPAYDDPRGRVVFEDARSYFARGRKQYDLILSEPSNPWVSGVAALFTEEFYSRIRSYLTDDGILVQWIQVYETNPRIVGSILTALTKSFPSWSVYASNNGDLILVAPKSGNLPIASGDVFAMPGVGARLDRIGIRSIEQLQLRQIGTHDTVGRYMAALAVQPNSDFFPLVDKEAPKSRFMGETGTLVHALSLLPVPVDELAASRRPVTWIDGARGDSVSPQEVQRAVGQVAWMHLMKGQELPDLHRNLAPSLFAIRTLLFECQRPVRPDTTLEALQFVASDIALAVPPEQAVTLWRQIESRNCLRGNAVGLQWLALFKAVSSRDTRAIDVAVRPLMSRFSEQGLWQKQYLLLAAATGPLAAGRHAEVADLVRHHASSIPVAHRQQPYFLYLLGSAADSR